MAPVTVNELLPEMVTELGLLAVAVKVNDKQTAATSTVTALADGMITSSAAKGTPEGDQLPPVFQLPEATLNVFVTAKVDALNSINTTIAVAFNVVRKAVKELFVIHEFSLIILDFLYDYSPTNLHLVCACVRDFM